jgi:hypothetical protein
MQENKAVNICQMNRTIVEAYGIQNSLVSNIPLVSAHHLTSQ